VPHPFEGPTLTPRKRAFLAGHAGLQNDGDITMLAPGAAPRTCDACRVLSQGWADQWVRVQRRLDCVRAIYSGRAGGSEAAIDDVQAFFESVHHLKDWLGNDAMSGITKADGDALINSSATLQVCADLANGTKHLVLTSTRTGDLGTSIARNDVTVFAGTGTAAHKFYVASGSTELDVLDLAERAVSEWAAFLHSRGLM